MTAIPISKILILNVELVYLIDYMTTISIKRKNKFYLIMQ